MKFPKLPGHLISLPISLALTLLPTLASVNAAAPTDQPLLYESGMTYLGSFKLPRPATGEAAASFDYGGGALAVSEDGNTLYAGGHVYNDSIGHVTIPNIGGTATLIKAPTTVPGTFGYNTGNSIDLGGALVYNGRLIVQKRQPYDNYGTGNTHAAGNLNISGFTSPTRLANIPSAQFANGYMGLIPNEWRNLLGGPAFAGNSSMSIISKTSSGPTFYVFDPDDVGVVSPVPSIPLMYFPFSNPLVEDPDAANDIWIRADQENSGIFFPSGTRSVLFVSKHGYGPRKYKVDDGCGGISGESAGPYRRQVTAFDANDILAVKNGTKNPYDIRPYGWWILPGPVSTCASMAYSGLTYDQKNNRLYIAFPFSSSPKVHVWQINNTPPIAPKAPTDTKAE